MNKKVVSVVITFAVLLSLAACKKNDSVNANISTTEAVEANTIMKETAPAETQIDIDSENSIRQTEPAVNKATIIDNEEEKKDEQSVSSSETISAEEVGIPVDELTEYEKLLKMSGEEQKKFMDSFESIDAFFEWLDAAKAEYENQKAPIEIGSDGVINIG